MTTAKPCPIDAQLAGDAFHKMVGATACAQEYIASAPDGVWLDVDKVDERDKGTPDDWICRHPELVRLTGLHPFNCEPPLSLCYAQGFICPPQLHYIRNHGAVPVKTPDAAAKQRVWDEWRVDVVGLVETPLRISMAELQQLPFRQLPVLLVCAGNRRKEQNMVKQTIGFSWGPTAWATTIWGGCRLGDLLRAAGVRDDPEGKLHVHFRGPPGELPKGEDGSYGTSIPLHRAMDPANDVLVAWEQNGRTLMPDHGFPVRLIIPGYIGGRMIKWLERIEVAPAESSNFYHFMDNRVLPVGVTPESATAEGWWYKPDYIINELNINSAMAAPAHDEALPITPDALAGETYTIKGYAYTGGGKKVIRAEISLDGGVTWEGGVVRHPETPTEYGRYWCHALWSFDVAVSRLISAKEVCCRAWDSHMNTQPNHLTWNVMGMLNNPVSSRRSTPARARRRARAASARVHARALASPALTLPPKTNKQKMRRCSACASTAPTRAARSRRCDSSTPRCRASSPAAGWRRRTRRPTRRPRRSSRASSASRRGSRCSTCRARCSARPPSSRSSPPRPPRRRPPRRPR